MLTLLVLACTGEKSGPLDLTLAVVDPARPTHFFDVPFPSNDLLDASGHPQLEGYPEALQPLAAGIVDGWRRRVELATSGMANNGAAYFRFEGPIEVPTDLAGTPDDPVVWVALDGSEQLPLITRFVADPAGDPFYGENTLAMAPALGHPPKPGGTYAAVVMQSAGVGAPEGYVLPAGVQDALTTLGITGTPAVATVFTVQDVVGELRQVAADMAARAGNVAPLAPFQRVLRLAYTQGATPGGEPASLATVTYEDGTTDVTYLEPLEGYDDRVVEFDESWPMVVYEGRIPTWNYQGLEDRPYMSPGIGHINDVERMTGWIQFDGGQLTSTPEPEWVRVTVSLPRGADGAPRTDVPWVAWDHGTGGHAYEPVRRLYANDDGRTYAQTYADAGWAVIGRDASLYGQRFPLIDEGFGASLGFYNVVNPPAFRDNQRQTALDAQMLLAAVESGALNAALPAGSLDPSRRRRGGHSMGSVTANLGVATDPSAWEGVFLSGSGGNFSHYFLDTGLLADLDPTLITSLYGLVGQPVPEVVTPATALGAILGLPETAWDHIDRMHPAIQLFQWQMDGSDPMAVARAEELPARMLICNGDYQVPGFTSHALAEALPNAEATEVFPTYEGDHHSCLWREAEADAWLGGWLGE